MNAEKIVIDYDQINILIARIRNSFYREFMEDQVVNVQDGDDDNKLIQINTLISNIDFIIEDSLAEEGAEDNDIRDILEEIKTTFLDSTKDEIQKINDDFKSQGEAFKNSDDELDKVEKSIEIADNSLDLEKVIPPSTQPIPENVLDISKNDITEEKPDKEVITKSVETPTIEKEIISMVGLSSDDFNKLNQSIDSIKTAIEEANNKIITNISKSPEEYNALVVKLNENTTEQKQTIETLKEVINKNDLELTEIVKVQVSEAISSGKLETQMSEKTEKLLKYSNLITIFSFLMIICFFVFGLQIYSDHTKYQNLMKVINSLSIDKQKMIKDIISNGYNGNN